MVIRNEKAPSSYYRVGDAVCADGIYIAYHNGHRLSHEVTLLAGETFPPCVQCGFDVHFELVREVVHHINDPDFDFKIKLYQLPHPPAEEEKHEEKSA